MRSTSLFNTVQRETTVKFYAAMLSVTAAALMLGGAVAPLSSSAQEYGPGYGNGPGYGYGPYGEPMYNTWQSDWNDNRYDRHHVVLGTVAGFTPYRLTVMRRNGYVETVDLKNGTVIRPRGATPSPGERVALVGYYSNGTFIANRVILRP